MDITNKTRYMLREMLKCEKIKLNLDISKISCTFAIH